MIQKIKASAVKKSKAAPKKAKPKVKETAQDKE